MYRKTLTAALMFGLAMPALAQEAAPVTAVTTAAPLTVEPRQAVTAAVLPANTEVVLSMNEDVTTKRHREGDTFYLSVVQDVMLGDYVIIPKGSRAVGEITWMTGKGAFGKSGKMEVSINAVEVAGRRIPLVGTFRQEGEGNTVATVAAVALVWVAAPFITGKTGVIPRGRELIVHTKEDLPLQLAGPAPAPANGPLLVKAAAPAGPSGQ